MAGEGWRREGGRGPAKSGEGLDLPGIDGVSDSGAPEKHLQVLPQALPQHLAGALALTAGAHHKLVQIGGAPQHGLRGQNGGSVVPGGGRERVRLGPRPEAAWLCPLVPALAPAGSPLRDVDRVQPRAQRGQVVVAELLAEAGVNQVHQAALVQAVQAAHSQHPLSILEQGPGPWGWDEGGGVSLAPESQVPSIPPFGPAGGSR